MRPATSFTVAGLAAPQGSKNPWGGEANPRTKPWRGAVSDKAAEAHRDRPLMAGPVLVDAVFVFPRPKSHYRTGKRNTELRDDAPIYKASKPDLDKLQRAIGDALTGVVFRDDAQIASWLVSKRYGQRAEVHITITDLAGGSHDDSNSTQAGEDPGGSDPQPHLDVPGGLRA